MSPKRPSLVQGRTDTPLYEKPLGTLLKERAACYGVKPALISHWQDHRASYSDLARTSGIVARALIDLGTSRGQHVGIFAGNRHEYIDVFLGGARIGRPLVVLNSMFTPVELCTAVERSACETVFISKTIGKKDLRQHIEALGCMQSQGLLKTIVVFGEDSTVYHGVESHTRFLLRAQNTSVTEDGLEREERAVRATDVLNLQFTSGTGLSIRKNKR
ncbi:hypothetical protein LTR74_012876 [Friedmanniomyces endolithicus]|nr:hypothetical protein LTR74_012876 [Friedmanniomyces endolithicus]